MKMLMRKYKIRVKSRERVRERRSHIIYNMYSTNAKNDLTIQPRGIKTRMCKKTVTNNMNNFFKNYLVVLLLGILCHDMIIPSGWKVRRWEITGSKHSKFQCPNG